MNVLAFPSRDNLSDKGTHTLLADFQRWLEESDRVERTRKEYVDDVRHFLAWLASVGGKIDEPTRHDLQDWRREMQVRRLSPATVNRRLVAVKVWCRSLGLDYDPTASVKGMKESRPGPQGPTRNEGNALLRVAERRGALESALIEFLLSTGARISEAAALSIEDLDIGERSGWVRIRHGKGDKARRVPLSNDCRHALRVYLAGRTDGRVWIGQRGPLTASGLYQIVKRIGDAAGVDTHPHALRHYFAKRVLGAVDPTGRPNQITEVQRLLGHESIRTTSRYLVPTETDLSRAVAVAFD